MELDLLTFPHFWSELPFGRRWVSKLSKRDFFSLIWSIIWQICGGHCICGSSICKVNGSAFCIYKGQKATKLVAMAVCTLWDSYSVCNGDILRPGHTGKKVYEGQMFETQSLPLYSNGFELLKKLLYIKVS